MFVVALLLALSTLAAPSPPLVPFALDSDAAAVLFIGTIQGLVVQSMVNGDVEGMRRNAGRVFDIYCCGIEVRNEPS